MICNDVWLNLIGSVIHWEMISGRKFASRTLFNECSNSTMKRNSCML